MPDRASVLDRLLTNIAVESLLATRSTMSSPITLGALVGLAIGEVNQAAASQDLRAPSHTDISSAVIRYLRAHHGDTVDASDVRSIRYLGELLLPLHELEPLTDAPAPDLRSLTGQPPEAEPEPIIEPAAPRPPRQDPGRMVEQVPNESLPANQLIPNTSACDYLVWLMHQYPFEQLKASEWVARAKQRPDCPAEIHGSKKFRFDMGIRTRDPLVQESIVYDPNTRVRRYKARPGTPCPLAPRMPVAEVCATGQPNRDEHYAVLLRPYASVAPEFDLVAFLEQPVVNRAGAIEGFADMIDDHEIAGRVIEWRSVRNMATALHSVHGNLVDGDKAASAIVLPELLEEARLLLIEAFRWTEVQVTPDPDAAPEFSFTGLRKPD